MSWFSFKKKAPKKVSHRKRHGRSFEILEKRQVLAGIVEFIFNPETGDISLKGDSAGNDFEFFRDDMGYHLVGRNGTVFQNKTPPLPDPVPDPFPTVPTIDFAFFNKIDMDLAGGDDKVDIHGTPATLTTFRFLDTADLKMGTGNDTLTLNGVIAFENLSFAGDSGSDSLTITDATFRANLSMTMGDGLDTISLTGTLPTGMDAARPIIVDGSLTAELGGGSDTFTAQFFQVDNNFNVTGGDGIDFVRISGLAETAGDGDDVDSGRASTINGSLNVDLGTGIDDLVVAFLTVAGSTSINGGADSDSIRILGSDDVEGDDMPNIDTSAPIRFDGNVSIDLGAGNNGLEIFYAEFGSALTITGGANSDNVTISGKITTPAVNSTPVSVFLSLSIDLGAGANSATLTYIDVGAALSYRGGVDGDNVVIQSDVPSARRTRIGGDVSIDVGAGGNSVSITYSDFENALSITGGAGSDNVTISGELSDDMPLLINGNVTINLGDGSNSLTLRYIDFNGNLTYTGGAAVDTVRILGVLGLGLTANHASTVEGNVSITTGASNDTVNVWYVLIDGNLTVNAGDGIDTVDIHGLIDPEDQSDPADTDTTDWGEQGAVGGNLTVDMGTGNDTLNVYYLNIGGNLNLNGGDGNDRIVFAGSIVIGTADAPDAVPNVTDIEDDDLIDTSTALAIGGSITIALGDGTNTLIGINVAADGGMTISGGTGIDTVLLNGTVGSLLPFTMEIIPFIVGGAVGISLGGGNDSLQVLGFEFGGTMTVLMGDGNDSAVIRGMPDTPKVGTPPVFSDPDAADSGIQSMIDGTFQADLGAGNDTLRLDYISLTGNVVVLAGVGNDTVLIVGQDDVELDDGFGPPFAFSVGGTVGVDLGAGNNVLLIDYLIAGGGMTILGGGNSDSVTIRGYPDKFPDNGVDDTIPSQITTSTGGTLVIDLGAGSDSLEINYLQIVNGGANISLGDGADNMIIGRLAAGNGAILIDTGAGADTGQIDDMSTAGAGANVTIRMQAGADKLVANFIVSAGFILIEMGSESDEVELGHLGEVGTGFDSSAQTTVTIDLGTAVPNSGIDSVKMDGVGANGEITVIKRLGGQSEMYLDYLTTNAGVTVLGNNETDTVRLFNSQAVAHFNITTFDPGAGDQRDGNDLVYISASSVVGGGISVSTGFDDDHVEIGLYVDIQVLLAPGFTFFFDGDLDGDGVFDGGRVQVRDNIVVDTGFVNNTNVFSGSDYLFVGWAASSIGDLIANMGDLADKVEIYNLTVDNVILNMIDSALDLEGDDTCQIGYLTTRETFDVVAGLGNDLISFYASRLIGVGRVNAGEDHDTVATVVQQYVSDFYIQMLTGYNTLICDNVISQGSFYYAATAGTGNAMVKNSQAVRMNLTLGNDADIATVTNNTFTNLFVSMGSGDDWLTVTGNYLPYELTVIGGEGRGDRLTMIGNAPRTTSAGWEAFY